MLEPDASSPAKSDEHCPQVLVAAHRAQSRDEIGRLLQHSFRVETASDGDEALNFVRQSTPDLVLIDADLPGNDGYALIHRLRSDPRTDSVPIILLTDARDEEGRVRAFQAGADDVIHEPIRERELLARIAARLRAASHNRGMEQRLVGLAEQLGEERDRLRAVLGSARCILWDADIRDTGDSLEWFDVQLSTDESLATAMLDVDRRPEETYLEAWRRARLPEDSERTRVNSEQQIRRNRSFTHEFRIAIKTGEVRWLHEDIHLTSLGPERWHAVGVCTDITEQKKVEARLREAEEQYRLLFDSNPQPMWVFDRESFRFLAVNQAAIDKYGYTREEFLAMGIGDIRPAEEVPRMHEYYRSIGAKVADGIDRSGVWTHRRKDGSLLKVEIAGSRIRFDGRDASLVVALDVTLRELAEEALRESEERFRTLADSAPVLIWVNDPQGAVYVNRSYREFLGVDPPEVKGYDWARFVHPEDRDRYLESYLQSAELRQVFDAEFRFRRHDGEFRWMRSVGRPRFSPSGDYLGYVGSTFDITDTKQAEQALRGRQAVIEELNQRLQRAMTETHHRVKNNLQVMAGLVDLQLLEGGEQIPAEEVRRIANYTRTLAAVHDLLTTEAKEHGDAHSLSARAVLEKLVGLLDGSAAGREMRTRIDDARLNARQSTSLALVASELINNAFKHGAGTIRVDFRAGAGRGVLEVRDEGPGFPRDFDVKTGGHTGLELVENLGRWDLSGDVRYSTVEGSGACVTVNFPLPNAGGFDSPGDMDFGF